ncbi:ATP12 family chaperone protein [Sphingomonas baiyangensis]|uniref:ATPase n=1 Tax=Sphingomonas baiyangensis TaxID=2572576 RepID=A0A4U1L528_9SPHN|nr:ATP12 family protein [Sphingomonas baiyangensis]TKD51296.1 ATPase [Sphingomonas baiyangensis]
MKRFWREVAVAHDAGGWGITLDARPVRTPGRAALAIPTQSLAEAIASEWREVGDTIDPRAMPLTGLANAAIDRIAPDGAGFAAGLARYAESDLLCYRAVDPPPLVARQAAAWQPLLDWAQARYDVHFAVTAGVLPVAQPPTTIARLGEAIAAQPPFALAPLSIVTTLAGSLVIALALAEQAFPADVLCGAATLDETWQAELWGDDSEAAASRAVRTREYADAVRFLEALRDA